MLNRNTFAPAIVQVKSGNEAVDLEALANAGPNPETVLFACSASGQFYGHPSREIRFISPTELVDLSGCGVNVGSVALLEWG
jgi:hypothetical protein